MTRRALSLAFLLLVACEQRIPARPAPPPPPAPVTGNYPPPPAGYAAPECALGEFTDKTGKNLGPEAAEQLESLLRKTGRFQLLDRKSAAGAKYTFSGTLHQFNAMVMRSEKSRPTDLQVVTEIELKLLDASGEILVHQRGNRSRQCNVKTWGLRDALPLDEDGRAKVLRTSIDEALKAMLPSFDEKFAK